MRRSVIGICCAAMIFGLASCGKDDSEKSEIPVKCASQSKLINNWKQCQITMTDTRRVTCLVYNDETIDCDWLHADGTDAHISDEGTTQ